MKFRGLITQLIATIKIHKCADAHEVYPLVVAQALHRLSCNALRLSSANDDNDENADDGLYDSLMVLAYSHSCQMRQ